MFAFLPLYRPASKEGRASPFFLAVLQYNFLSHLVLKQDYVLGMTYVGT